jgi:hypothetical protein
MGISTGSLPAKLLLSCKLVCTEVAELAVLPFIYLLIYTKCSSA